MDFVFHCSSCHGPLIARNHLRGTRMECAHCAVPLEVREGQPVTDSVVNTILDAPEVPAPQRTFVLRRVRPAVAHSSAGRSHSHPQLTRHVRISHAF